MPRPLTRRDFLRSGIVTIGAITLGPSLWRSAVAAPAQTGEGPYGPLLPPDENGIRLPEGFSSRVIARAGELVPGTAYVWHVFPDGGATFATDDGGWIYVSNSEVPFGGGVGAVRFDADGHVVDAYRVLAGTSQNCAGGPTPWGTWLSCEEHPWGQVWECDPTGLNVATVLPAMGTFQHEAAAVDPARGHVYLTEDRSDGLFYRFTPDQAGDLSSGLLEAAEVADLDAVTSGGRSTISWHEVPDPNPTFPAQAETRTQVPEATPFRGGEGTWFDADAVYFTTKGDNRVWAFHLASEELELFYDDDLDPERTLTGVDNVMVSADSGDVFVAEDGGDLDIVMITPDGVAARLLKVTGPEHSASELAGPALNPAGDRFYFSSQRGNGSGITYEITGPFRKTRE